MTTTTRDITPDEAAALLPLVVGRLFVKDWNWDLLLRLSDGRILAFDSECDEGPESWTISDAR